MSQVLKNEGSISRRNRKADREYEALLNDPLIFSIDEVLQVLGPRHEKI